MSCTRYYVLLRKLYAAADQETTQGKDPASTVAYQEALARVRVHSEDCQECIDGVIKAFPELANKELHTQSLLA